MVVIPDWTEPEGQGKAEQEVDVGDEGRARVTLAQEGEKQLMQRLTIRPDTTDTTKLGVN